MKIPKNAAKKKNRLSTERKCVFATTTKNYDLFRMCGVLPVHGVSHVCGVSEVVMFKYSSNICV